MAVNSNENSKDVKLLPQEFDGMSEEEFEKELDKRTIYNKDFKDTSDIQGYKGPVKVTVKFKDQPDWVYTDDSYEDAMLTLNGGYMAEVRHLKDIPEKVIVTKSDVGYKIGR